MTRCVLCHQGDLRRIRLTLTLAYEGTTYTIDENYRRVCEHCGEEYMGRRRRRPS